MKDHSEQDDSGDHPLILLTGSTGFVGTHVSRHLVESGFRVRCLVRKTSDTSRLPRGVDLSIGHLLNFESLQEAVRDCQAVMHVGGLVRAKKVREFYHVNRDGTSNLVKAAREAGVERFLLCSSQAAAGPSKPDQRRRWDDPPRPVTDYGRSKLSGEEALQKNAGDMWFGIVRPPAVYGPYDIAFLTLVKWIKFGFKPRLGASGLKLISLIHAEDLARALTLALTVDHPSGAIWFATDGVDHDMSELMEAIERALGKSARWITIPHWVTPTISYFVEIYAGLRRGDTALLSRSKLNELIQPAWTCEDEPFRLATGYREKYNLADGWAQTVEWYRREGWI